MGSFSGGWIKPSGYERDAASGSNGWTAYAYRYATGDADTALLKSPRRLADDGVDGSLDLLEGRDSPSAISASQRLTMLDPIG